MGTVRRMWKTVTLSVLVLLLPHIVRGQATSGHILGRITDRSGSVIAGVTVSVTSDCTGLTRTATSDADGGRDMVSTLPPDVYSLTAAVQRFKAVKRTGLSLLVDQALRINFALEVGDFTEVVDVAASTPLLQTQSAATGEVIEQRQIQDLPLLGRDFLKSTRLTAGTTAGQ